MECRVSNLDTEASTGIHLSCLLPIVFCPLIRLGASREPGPTASSIKHHFTRRSFTNRPIQGVPMHQSSIVNLSSPPLLVITLPLITRILYQLLRSNMLLSRDSCPQHPMPQVGMPSSSCSQYHSASPEPRFALASVLIPRNSISASQIRPKPSVSFGIV